MTRTPKRSASKRMNRQTSRNYYRPVPKPHRKDKGRLIEGMTGAGKKA